MSRVTGGYPLALADRAGRGAVAERAAAQLLAVVRGEPAGPVGPAGDDAGRVEVLVDQVVVLLGLREVDRVAVPGPETDPEPAPAPPAATAEFDLLKWLTSGGDAVPDIPELHQEAEAMFAADLVAGRLPGIRAIREGMHIGQDKATQVQAYLRTLVTTP